MFVKNLFSLIWSTWTVLWSPAKRMTSRKDVDGFSHCGCRTTTVMTIGGQVTTGVSTATTQLAAVDCMFSRAECGSLRRRGGASCCNLGEVRSPSSTCCVVSLVAMPTCPSREFIWAFNVMLIFIFRLKPYFFQTNIQCNEILWFGPRSSQWSLSKHFDCQDRITKTDQPQGPHGLVPAGTARRTLIAMRFWHPEERDRRTWTARHPVNLFRYSSCVDGSFRGTWLTPSFSGVWDEELSHSPRRSGNFVPRNWEFCPKKCFKTYWHADKLGQTNTGLSQIKCNQRSGGKETLPSLRLFFHSYQQFWLSTYWNKNRLTLFSPNYLRHALRKCFIVTQQLWFAKKCRNVLPNVLFAIVVSQK